MPKDALARITAALIDSQTLLAGRARETDAEPTLGMLAAAGPRARGAEGDYAFVVEAIREGYLLHYGTPRVLAPDDPDEALLAGDFLYAAGLECLAGLGDLDAVRELADLISLSAQLHADGPDAPAAGALWLASATAVGAGASEAHDEAKRALRAGEHGAADALLAEARRSATAAGMEAALDAAARA